MNELLFKPYLYINEVDFVLFSVKVSNDFWKGNLKEQYTFAFQDKITNSLKADRIEKNHKQDLLTDSWQISNMDAIQIINESDRRLAEFITDTDFCYQLISDFIERLEIIKAGKDIKNYYEINDIEYDAGLLKPPYEIEDIDFLTLTSLIAEY